MSGPFVHRLRVRYSECDQQGVVFNGNYLFYYDVALTELLRIRIGSYQAFIDSGFDIVVAEARLRFHNGARFDEDVDIEMPVHHLGTTSMIVHPVFRVDGRLVVDGEVRHVFVDPESLTKKPMSQEIRDALAV
ncbi:MAG TPA: acyl-CoA thioesterase [Micromonosporaceae bacterium]|nr:acyl-CoA thioesterase [Micromonosporaceae bacterium]